MGLCLLSELDCIRLKSVYLADYHVLFYKYLLMVLINSDGRIGFDR